MISNDSQCSLKAEGSNTDRATHYAGEESGEHGGERPGGETTQRRQHVKGTTGISGETRHSPRKGGANGGSGRG